jgi:serine/threonine protein kinase/WD40 repeat protein
VDIEPHLKLGRTLNHRYRIDRLLATGGFGEVYVAFDTLMDRKVALKYIFRRLNIEQLRNEVIILARHAEKLKFIPNVYDHWAGSASDTGYYIVIEFVDGETLDKSRSLPWPSDAVTAFLHILLSNLRALHSLGIVHCDIKPVNIKVTPPSNLLYHVPYMLLDFGIAKQGDDTSVPGASPHYSAPEQHSLGKQLGKLDRRADLYGLAATAYFLVTGRPPIDAKIRYTNAFDLGLGDTLPPPSALIDDIAPALEATLLDMLQLDREQRPYSAEDALQILDERLRAAARAAEDEPRSSATELATNSDLVESVPELPRILVTELPANAEQPISSLLPAPAAPAATSYQDLAPVAPLPPSLAMEPAASLSIVASMGPLVPAAPTIAPVEMLPASAAPAVPAPTIAAGKAAVLLDKQGDGSIISMIWSFDGQAILIGTTIGVYHYSVQTTICELWQATDTPVQHVGITCAGQKVVLTTGDTVRMLDVTGGPAWADLSAPTQVLPGQVLTAMHGRSIAIVTDDTFYIFNPDTGLQAAAWRLSAHLTGRRAALSGDGQTVVVADADQLWCSSLRSDLRGRQWIIGGLPQPLVDLTLTPDSRIVAIASPHAIAIWRRGEKEAQTLTYTGEPIVQIALSSDGATLSVSTDTQVFLRPVNDTGKPKPLSAGDLIGVRQLMFSPDDRMLAAASSGELRLWRIRDGALEQAITQFEPRGQYLALLAGRRNLAVLGHTLQQWSIDHSQLLPGPQLGSAPARSLGVLADAQGELVAVAADTALQIWKLAEQSLQNDIAALPAQEHCLSFAADSGHIMLVTRDSVEVYDPSTGNVRARVALGDAHSIDHIALAGNGSRLSIHANGRIIVRRLPDGDVICTLQAKADREITAIGLDADGTQLAVADEAKLTLWRIDEDMPTRLGSAALPEGAPAHHLIFAPNGALLASLHGAVVHIWHIGGETLRQIGSARGHTDRVTDTIIVLEGTRIVTASRDGTLRLWQIPD